MKEILDEGINDKYLFKSVFMAGGGGSGKGWVVSNYFGIDKKIGMSPQGIKVVNSDNAFEYLLKRSNLPLTINMEDKNTFDQQMVQRELAKEITNKRLSNFIDGMLPLIMDGTGKDFDKIKKQKLALEGLGYDTAMIFVNTTLDVAQKRNMSRERKIDPSIIEASWYEVQNNIGKFQSLFGIDNFIIIDNSTSYTDEQLNKIIISMFKAGEKLFSKPLKNRKGNYIISYLKKNGGKTLRDIPDIDF